MQNVRLFFLMTLDIFYRRWLQLVTWARTSPRINQNIIVMQDCPGRKVDSSAFQLASQDVR